ncbi:unnamed protein product [Allacma fusca]|uniref:Lipase n=2 Tax=Allacma fusca TaxID=39272 RepID=A0A8J2LQY7_9HEXA|nr:unnamed protein product [Allacma fusca]
MDASREMVICIAFCAVCQILATKCPPPFHLLELTDLYNDPPPEAFMNTPELIRHFNYPVESHDVTTSDGYILTIFRIPYSNKTADPKVQREPVLVQHGLVCSSDNWLLVGEESNLPFLLADRGFDVWLGNSRGNDYSQRHLWYSMNSTEFWDFSFHEMGVYDLPAVIDFVLKTTGTKQLSYVGHSMGTTMFFIGMDRHKRLQEKVRKMVAMAPVAYLSHIKTPMKVMALFPNGIYSALTQIFSGGRIMFTPFNNWLKKVAPSFCSGEIPTCFCEDIMFFMTGFDYSQCSHRTSSSVAGHTPSDGSGKTLEHYFQWVRSDTFREYDYGLLENWKRYGASEPPIYNLEVNKVETLVLYAQNDWLVTPEDSTRAFRELGNATSIQIALDAFSHMDFQYAADVKKEVYDQCIDFLV